MAKVERSDDLPSAESAIEHERAERKETENLLDGFDRPPRSPRRSAGESEDFVAYHDRSEPRSARIVVREPSLVVPKNEIPAAMKWIALVVLAISIAGTAAWVLTPSPTKVAEPVTASAPPPPWIPPPPPVPAVEEAPAIAVTAPVKPAARKEPKPPATSAAATKPAARSDFVRDL